METLQPPPQLPFSSSPAFGTPLHPIPPTQQARPLPAQPAFKPPPIPTILPTSIPPPTLRPLAFRTFTKKHNLTLHASALQSLATFIGRHCGSGWREEGTGERVLEEVARTWKAESGGVIVEDGEVLRRILKGVEAGMSGGRVGVVTKSGRPSLLQDGARQSNFGLSSLHVHTSTSHTSDADAEDESNSSSDPRSHLKVISAFTLPRLTYSVDKKHYLPHPSAPSAFPPPSHKTALFKERYDIIHQRLLRNTAFQIPTHTSTTTGQGQQDHYKTTPIANLLGRNQTSHLLLGMLAIAPTGTLALNDPSGSISLSLDHASALQECYFCPGMIVLVDGVYEESFSGAGSSGLGGTGGVGGTVGGRFIAFSIGAPPVEKRNVSLGIDLGAGDVGGGGFGWTDFLGLGSERAVGAKMRRLESRCLQEQQDKTSSGAARRKMVILGEVTLDNPATLAALRHVLSLYQDEPPMAFLLTGNFASTATLSGSSTGSIEYKELLNDLAAVLADYPSLLKHSTWIFVPGDNDPWSSAFSAGASVLVPRGGVPDVFTSRVKRAFASAKAEAGVGRKKDGEVEGECIFTTNPTRLSLFGPAHEIAVFRDDVSGRLRRHTVRVGQAVVKDPPPPSDVDVEMSEDALPTTEAQTQPSSTDAYADARKLILSLLPQSTLSPFPLSLRPTHWDYTSSALSLYPLPHTLILADAEAEPFALTFEGCHVVNPGRLVSARRKARWCEYDFFTKRGVGREGWVG